MVEKLSIAYSVVHNSIGQSALRPMLPLTLNFADRSVEVIGLVDTGADVNVLPYNVGVALGADWDAQTTSVQLSGNLAAIEARGILVNAFVGQFPPVRLVFAWSRLENVPLLLGQVNFLMAFDVCFFRTDAKFELALR